MLSPKVVRTFDDDGTCFDITVPPEMAGSVQALLGRRVMLNGEPHIIDAAGTGHTQMTVEAGDTLLVRARPITK